MRLAWLPALLCCCLFSNSLLAVNASVSRSVFYHMHNTTVPVPYISMSWQADPKDLHYYKAGDSGLVAHIRTKIVLRNDTGVLHEEQYLLNTPPLPSKLAVSQNIIDNYRHTLSPGTIYVELTLSEEGFGNAFRFRDSFTVAAPAATPFYSSLQLIDTSFPAGAMKHSPFSRNGQVYMPLSSGFLDENRNTLHYYVEAYLCNKLSPEERPAVQTTFVTRKKGEGVVLNLLRRDTLRNEEVQAIPGSLPVGHLPSGNYFLNTELRNVSGKLLSSQSLFFQRINPQPQDAPVSEAAPAPDTAPEQVNVVDLGKSFVAKYTTAQVKAILKMVLPTADQDEAAAIRSFQKTPDDTYMRYFIINFFTKRNPEDPKGEWEKYTNKIRQVNKLFSAGGRAGYETDRGGIYLKYGEPAERIITRSEQGSRPYEIWVYNALPKYKRTSYFLFYQPANIVSDYELLHTTVPDEKRNSGWRSFLYVSGNNPSSRAEQYIGNR